MLTHRAIADSPHSRVGTLILALLTLIAAVPLQALESSSQKVALLIGIDDYRDAPALSGAGNDVELMKNVLTGRLAFEPEDIEIIRDAEATGDGIRDALRRLVGRVTTDAVVVVHFSGYGSQVEDVSGDELDGFDEAIVPVDAVGDASRYVTDDELNALLRHLTWRTRHLTLILDTCFLAQSPRGGTRGRCIPGPGGGSFYKSKGASTAWDEVGNARSPYAVLSAAGLGQIANEAYLGTGTYGAFTYELAQTLIHSKRMPSFREALERIALRIGARFPTQDPALEASNADAPLFYDATPRAEFAGLVVNISGFDALRVSAGRVHGVANGAELDVYPPGTLDFSNPPLSHIFVSQVGDLESIGITLADSRPPRYAVVRVGAPRGSYRLSVWLEPGREVLDQVRSSLADDPRFWLTTHREHAQIQVEESGDRFRVISGDLAPLNERLRTEVEVRNALLGWSRWFSVLNMANPDSQLGLDLQVFRDRSREPLDGPARPGEILRYRVVNHSDVPLVVQTVLLSTSGSIALSRSSAGKLGPGESSDTQLGTFLPEGRRRVTDTIKVFGSVRPVDLEGVVDPRLRIDPDRFEGADWTTAEVSYELERNTSRVAGFAVHLAAPNAGPDPEPFGRQSVCRPDRYRDCIDGQAISADGSLIIVESSFARSDPDEVSPGTAFQEAYAMRAELGADRVEPLFEVAMADEPVVVGARSSGGGDDPIAAANKQWSLEYIDAPAAWKRLRERGRRAGREAEGVRIAHLDTGYRTHPELFPQDFAYPTVIPRAGVDLVDGGDPYDSLSTRGVLPNPGHGTGSGSVIVSPPGCQLEEGESPCVTGVAPGAQLIPVRVHTSVVVLNQRRMVDAIYQVAEGRVDEDPAVISIAMGGPPSWSLWRAVRAAERAGIVIVAAAGNNVGTVVWPARFDSTIAAAAIDVHCKSWSGSSEGSRVDISAPGESVWRAQVDLERQRDVIGMGTGTTFATANTTGAAALWVAMHESSADFEALRASGGLTEAFRRALQNSAWRPVQDQAGRPKTSCGANVGWDKQRHGAGILNASRLLDLPLDTTAERAQTSLGLADLPLFATIYPPSTALDQVSEDYAALFPENEREGIEIYEVEILYHYATNAFVRRTLDQIAAGSRGAQDYRRAREALLTTDLSKDLRRRLS